MDIFAMRYECLQCHPDIGNAQVSSAPGRLSSESATSFAESVCVTLCAAQPPCGTAYEAVRRPLPAGQPRPAKQERQLGCWLPGSTWMAQIVNQAALHRGLDVFPHQSVEVGELGHDRSDIALKGPQSWLSEAVHM